MHYDALTTACIAAELQRQIVGGRVQGVLLPDEHSVGLEVYAHGQRRQLLLVAASDAARVLVVEHKLRRGAEGETPLLLLLRKYLRDGVLTGVTQPDPFERVLHFAFQHKEHGATTLVVELIGRRPNLLLLRPDGRILECLHRHPAGENARRVLLPGRLYSPPPAQAKLPPLDDGRPDYYEQLAAVLAAPGPLAKVLTAKIAGLSPTAAREIAWRTVGDAEAPATAANVLALAAALQGLWSPLRTGEWQPGLLRQGEQVVGFTPYAAHTGGELVPTASLSEAVAAYFASVSTTRTGRADWTTGNSPSPPHPLTRSPSQPADPYTALRAEVAALLRRARAGVQRRLDALAGDEPPPGEAERLRTNAEWLLALSTQLTPEQTRLEVPLEDETLVINIDLALGPVEQAQRLFRRAAKFERAAVLIPQRRAELEGDMALLDQLALDLTRAANQPEIAAVRAELAAAGLIARSPTSQRPNPVPASGLLRLRSPQGLEILVGRNARQNERVTFNEAHPEDLWLHARNVPGAHVVIRSGGHTPDDETVRLAAQWAAYHSGARGDAAVNVTVTRKRWVMRAPGGKLGQVLVKQEEQVITVPGETPN